ncbi:MAG: D-erythronate dehydrogenase [Pseudomonadota bacterium]
MKVLILGGGGFLGQKLAQALAARGHLAGGSIEALTLADIVTPPPVEAPFPVHALALDIADAGATHALLGQGFQVVYHLAAVVSGQAEAEFDTGLGVNLHGALNVFEGARRVGNTPVVVFASSLAVFGGPCPEPIHDWSALTPQTSYGAQKAAAELLLTDYARKGFLDGRGLRLPTITVRPGTPNKAASSFLSSIFREPLQGQEAVCPVAPEFQNWVLSPRRCIANLIHGAEVEPAALGALRCFSLPGLGVSVAEMIAAMERVAGPEPGQRIRWERDPAIEAIVGDWKVRFEPTHALSLGFEADDSFEDNIRYFLADDRIPQEAHP